MNVFLNISCDIVHGTTPVGPWIFSEMINELILIMHQYNEET